MELTPLDVVMFVGFLAVVVGVSLYASRKEETSEDYFLAGRNLGWWLIGFSLIASNISTEHFVGMAGSAFGNAGLAIAAYEWTAAIAMVVVAWWLLPKFLRAGIYTMPEFLEYRYDSATRSIMAGYMIVAYTVVLLAVVLYSGALALNGIFDFPTMLAERYVTDSMSAEETNRVLEWADSVTLTIGIWAIGIIASIYTVYGGLKAVVWSDLLQGGALLLGGLLVTVLCLNLIGEGSVFRGWSEFRATSGDKLHVVLPWNDRNVPWLAVMTGLWIPQFFYWGLNQFITQRTLAARSLADGQKGVFLAAVIKLVIPFIIVLPGIMAYQLFGKEIQALGGNAADKAYPYLFAHVLPVWLRGIMLAALVGAVVSTFNSGLNSASTVFTIDIYRKYINRQASEQRQVFIGRIATATIAVLACLWAPIISRFAGVFHYIQEIWGFISPGVVAVFFVGLMSKKVPAAAAKVALVLSVFLYALCRVPGWIMDNVYAARGPDGNVLEDADGQAIVEIPAGFLESVYTYSQWSFLYHMGIVFVILVGIMLVMTAIRPCHEERTLPHSGLDLKPFRLSYPVGGMIIAAVVLLYVAFW